MFESDWPHPFGNRVKKFVTIVMFRAEQFQRLVNEVAVQLEQLGPDHQFLGAVRDCVQRDSVAQVIAAEIFACENGAVDEDFVIDGFVSDYVARRRRGAQRRGGLPAHGIGDGRGDGNLPCEISGGIERDGFPLQVEHFLRDDDASLIGGCCRCEFKTDVERAGAARRVYGKCKDIDGVAFPDKSFTVRLDDQARQFLDLAARGVIAGKPFGEEQRDGAAFNRNALLHPENGAVEIGHIDFQRHRAGIGNVFGDRDGIDDRQRLRRAVCGEGGRRDGSKKRENKDTHTGEAF